MQLKDLQKYSPILLRLSISLVFLWFGITQLTSPTYLISYLPNFILNSNYSSLFILLNGIFETLLGLFLLLGLFTRIVSLILTLHLLVITLSLGYNDIAIRDFGLTLATLAIFLHGKDNLCLDNKVFK